MQNASLSYIKKKYTVVEPITILAGNGAVEVTISHIGGRNAAVPADTVTLLRANPDSMLTDQMKLYQFFKITGVGFKMFFPEGTTP